MNIYDHYNPLTHQGFLPVRVLQHNVIHAFENIYPTFLDKVVLPEIESSGLQKGITYNIIKQPIVESSEITENHKIIIHENYNQFLWAISYAIIVLFDEGIQIPLLQKKYDGKFDLNNIFVKRAISLFKASHTLFTSYNDWVFYSLPNPEKFNEYEKYYIEKANGVFVAAMTFTLAHEFAHQYYGHVEIPEKPEDEFTADDFAFETVSNKFDTNHGPTFMAGAIASLTSLFFFDDNGLGGVNHPDPDIRLKKQLEKLTLADCNNLWGFAALSVILWLISRDKEFVPPKEVEHFKELFYLSLDEVAKIKISGY